MQRLLIACGANAGRHAGASCYCGLLGGKKNRPLGMCPRARALGFSLRAQRGTDKPLAELGTPPLQHCPEVRCDGRANSGRTIE